MLCAVFFRAVKAFFKILAPLVGLIMTLSVSYHPHPMIAKMYFLAEGVRLSQDCRGTTLRDSTTDYVLRFSFYDLVNPLSSKRALVFFLASALAFASTYTLSKLVVPYKLLLSRYYNSCPCPNSASRIATRSTALAKPLR